MYCKIRFYEDRHQEIPGKKDTEAGIPGPAQILGNGKP